MSKPKRVTAHFVLAEDIANKLELIFWDPVREQARYGARSALINKLLREWLRTLPKSPGLVEDIIQGLKEKDDGTV